MSLPDWEWQADEVLPTRTMQVIGGLRTYAARMQFFLGVPNTLMIGVLFYNDSALIQSYVPTVYHWVAIILFGVVPAAVLVDRVILHPSQIIYQSHQVDSPGRSPNYQVTVETREAVRDLQQQLDERDNS
jgi:hypothetical protein